MARDDDAKLAARNRWARQPRGFVDNARALPTTLQGHQQQRSIDVLLKSVNLTCYRQVLPLQPAGSVDDEPIAVNVHFTPLRSELTPQPHADRTIAQ